MSIYHLITSHLKPTPNNKIPQQILRFNIRSKLRDCDALFFLKILFCFFFINGILKVVKSTIFTVTLEFIMLRILFIQPIYLRVMKYFGTL